MNRNKKLDEWNIKQGDYQRSFKNEPGYKKRKRNEKFKRGLLFIIIIIVSIFLILELLKFLRVV
ncbi:MAG: hypothetical protein NTX22_12565 [Ignavibacteriales bacterium]|nr:hypothetical protein [Ignavibacteriales bacterium]